MGNPLTSSERRGIVIIGAVALLIIGSGLLLNFCKGGHDVSEPEIREIIAGDSVARSDRQAPGNRVAGDSAGGRPNRKSRKDSLKGEHKERAVKSYRRRSHLDDPVGK